MLKSIKYSLLFTLLVSFSCRNSSNEVLDAFGVMNEELDKSNNLQQMEIDSLNIVFNSIGNYKAEDLNTISDSLYSYINTLKRRLTSKLKNPTDYSKMDDSKFGDQLFFNSNGNTKVGQEFVDKLKYYKEEVNHLFGKDFPDINKRANEILSINDINKVSWLEYHFKGFPIIATITKLTQIQSDINLIKRDLLIEMIKN